MGTVIGTLVVGIVLAFGAYFAFRGDEELLPDPTPVPTAVVVVTATMPASSPTSQPTASATPTRTPTPLPSPTLPAGRRSVPAPIDSVRVEVQDSPRRYLVVAVARLPNGCAMQYTQDVKREGDVFTVTVLNSVPTADTLCTLIARTYEVRVTITDSLQAGRSYTVRVNDKQATFTAR
jgi:hypothetical protein